LIGRGLSFGDVIRRLLDGFAAPGVDDMWTMTLSIHRIDEEWLLS